MSTRQFGGVSRFLELLDAPNSYVGQAGLYARVNATEDGLEFAAGGGGGSQTPWLSDIDAAGYDLNNLNVLQAQSLYDPANNFVANLSSGKLSDLIGVGSVDVENRELIDSSGTVKLNWAGPALFLDDRVIIGGGSDDGINDLQLAGSNSIIFGSQITQSLLGTVFNFNNPAFAQANAELNLWTQSDGATALSNGDVLTWDAANSRWAGAAGGGGGLYALIDASNQPFTDDIGITAVNPRFTLTDIGDPDSPTAYIEKLTTNNEFRLVSQNRVFLSGNGLVLNGSGYANRAAINLGTVWSVEGWYKTNSTASQMLASGNTGDSILLWFSAATTVTVRNTAGLFALWTVTYADNAWHHWAVTANGTSLTLYKDGVSQGTQVTASAATHYFTSIGNYGVDQAHKCVGTIDQVVVWNKALSLAEVQARYNSGMGAILSSYTNVIGEYRFDSNYNDSSPNAYHLSAGGTGNTFATGQVPTAISPLSDIQVLSIFNNAITGSYGTLRLGDYSASYGTTNIYEGLSHQVNILGVSKLLLRSSTLTIGANVDISMTSGTGRILVGTVGAAANPAISCITDSNSGVNIGGDQIDFVTGGTVRVQLSNSTTRFQFGSVAVPGIGFVSDTDQGFYGSLGLVGVSSGNYAAVTWTNATTTSNATTSFIWNVASFTNLSLVSNQIKGLDGTASLPFWSFINDTGIGIYRVSSNVLGFATAGIQRMNIGSGGGVTITMPTDASLSGMTAIVPTTATTIGGTYAGLSLVNSDLTNNNYARMDFLDAANGTSSAVIVCRFVNHTTKEGNLGLHVNNGTARIERIDMYTLETVVNESGGNIDFRVEGDTDQNLIFADASTDKVGFGNNAPAYKIDVTGEINASTGYRVGGTAGITSSGAFTNFTIVGGIITAAS